MEVLDGIELDGQYRILREGAGLVAGDDRRLIAVRGSEAADYLHGQLTNEVEALAPGEGCYAALLDRKGRMQGDMRVLRTGDDELLVEVADVAVDAVLRHLGMYKIGRDAEVADVSAELAVLSVIGPAAREVASTGPLSPEHAHRELDLAGTSARAVATDLGIDLIVAADTRDAVGAALRERGAEPVSREAAEVVRVESGRPRFGREMSTTTIPQEAGINERAVSFTKGCYIGQETVARLHYKGKPNRHLRGLRLAAPVASGDAVRLGERELGQIGTAVLSPAHGPIALAILRREGEPGAKVSVGEGTEATIVELPF
jgi:folate-binding protein YgfZ